MTPPVKKRSALDWAEARARLSRAAEAHEAHRDDADRIRALLDRRAKDAARVPEVPPAAGEVIEVVLFTLADERYALETRWVREVLRLKDITPLPGTPDFLAGITNLRGQILAVFDLRRWLGIAAPLSTDQARVVVLGLERLEFGFLADAVQEVTTLRIDALREPPASLPGAAREFLRGVTAEALIVLDGAVLLDDPRFYIDLGEDAAALSLEVKP